MYATDFQFKNKSSLRDWVLAQRSNLLDSDEIASGTNLRNDVKIVFRFNSVHYVPLQKITHIVIILLFIYAICINIKLYEF